MQATIRCPLRYLNHTLSLFIIPTYLNMASQATQENAELFARNWS